MNRCAPNCDDQLPMISHVGRGPKGDTSKIRVKTPDTTNETYIEGWDIDSDTGEEIKNSHWITQNINGGELSYQYNLRPYTIPRTFTITFIYRRPGRKEWVWTTPAIPYIWTVENNGKPEEDPDHIVGSGVATLFIKTASETNWHERLNYPEGTTREDFNAPKPNEAWTSTIVFGHGGDIDVPDFDDIAKVIGITKSQLNQILDGNSITIDGINTANLIDYIKKKDNSVLDHVHADLGFGSSNHAATGAFGGSNTVKAYIDSKIAAVNQSNTTLSNQLNALTNEVNALKQKLNNLITNIKDLIYGAEIGEDGSITIPNGTKVPTGNINVFSGDPTASGYGYIRTSSGTENNDLKGE